MPRPILKLLGFACLLAPLPAVACDQPEKTLIATMAVPAGTALPESVENKIASCLDVGTRAYLAELDKISFLNFKGKTITPETAVVLQTEARDVAERMRAMLATVAVIRETPYQARLIAWTHVAREIAVTADYAGDLEEYDLIQSRWNRALRLVLPQIFDAMILPRLETQVGRGTRTAM